MPENLNDAVPTMGYAITAYRRAGGDPKSKYWKNYTDAIVHFSQMHGPEAAKQLQEIAMHPSLQKGDLNRQLTSYSKAAIDSRQPVSPVIKNMLAMSYDGQNPLDKFQYAFDIPDEQQTTVAKQPELAEKLKTLLQK